MITLHLKYWVVSICWIRRERSASFSSQTVEKWLRNCTVCTTNWFRNATVPFCWIAGTLVMSMPEPMRGSPSSSISSTGGGPRAHPQNPPQPDPPNPVICPLFNWDVCSYCWVFCILASSSFYLFGICVLQTFFTLFLTEQKVLILIKSSLSIF